MTGSADASDTQPENHDVLLSWLAPVSYDSLQHSSVQRQHPGSLEWFLNSEPYQSWIREVSSPNDEEQARVGRTLFCPGPTGAGKTVLASAVAEDLQQRFRRGSVLNIGVASVFCVSHLHKEQSATNLLLLFLEQIVPGQSRPPLWPCRLRGPAEIYNDTGYCAKVSTGRAGSNLEAPFDREAPSLLNIARKIEKVVSTYDCVFLIVDALDECLKGDRTAFLNEILGLQVQHPIHLFITSDFSTDITSTFLNTPTVEICADPDDLISYLGSFTGQFPAIAKAQPELQEEIKLSITKASKGRFLQATLLAQSLAGLQSSSTIRDALKTLGDDYDGAYEAIMHRIQSQARNQVDLAQRALSCIFCAVRPLSVAELRHALAVKTDDVEIDCANMPAISLIISSCAGLVILVGPDENKSEIETDLTTRVRLVHRTTYDYLERTCERWIPNKEKAMAISCMAYLSLSCFGQEVWDDCVDIKTWLRTYPFYSYAVQYWGFHARMASSKFPGMGLVDFGFLASDAHLKSACKAMARIGLWPEGRSYSVDFPRMTGLHLAAYHGVPSLARMLCHGSGMRAGLDMGINTADSYGRTPLAWAARQGHEETLQVLMDIPGVDLDARCRRGQTPLLLATEHHHDGIIDKLLKRSADPNLADLDDTTPLSYAVAGGHMGTVKILVKHGADVNFAATNNSPIPLLVAGKHGRNEIVRFLLDQPSIQPRIGGKHWSLDPMTFAILHGHQDVVEMLWPFYINKTARLGRDEPPDPLHFAVHRGKKAMVQLLLQNGCNVNIQTFRGQTALHLAAEIGDCDIAASLLSRPDILLDIADDYGATPASVAAYQGEVGVMRLLSAAGADLEARNNENRTPLSLAAVWQSESVVELLLTTEGVDVNPRDSKGNTPLSLAAKSGSIYIVELLLAAEGVDVNSQNSSGDTPLCIAAYYGDADVVNTLMFAGGLNFDTKGLDINARGNDGKTALHHAAAMGHGAVARYLLWPDIIDANIQEESGRAPLHHAAKGGHQDIVILLLEVETVDVNCRDLQGLTPLALASMAGHASVVEMLLAHEEVMPNLADNSGRTPLSWAVDDKVGRCRSSNSIEVSEILLGVDNMDPDVEDNQGWTPLFWALNNTAGSHSSQLVDLILTDGSGRVDINHKDRKARTPLSLALERGDTVFANQLRAAGAKETDVPISGHGHYSAADSGPTSGQGNVQLQQGSLEDSDESSCETDAFHQEGGSEVASSLVSGNPGRWFDGQEIHSEWFGPRPGSGGSSPYEWSGTSESNPESNPDDDGTSRFWDEETHIQLRDQTKDLGDLGIGSGNPGDVPALCQQCAQLNLDALFSRGPPDGFEFIADIGLVDETWESRRCPMCQLIASIRPRTGRCEQCKLYAYSSTVIWLSRDRAYAQFYFFRQPSRWVDTVILGLEYSTSAFVSGSRPFPRSDDRAWLDTRDVLRFGFIGRLGSNGNNRLNALTIHRLRTDTVDWDRARGWIDCCAARHNRWCTERLRRPVPYFRLIDCTTRRIVEGRADVDQFVALSYVWGHSPADLGGTDHTRVGEAECVVEDAIVATLALGYTYLWVDRHCIVVADDKVRREQLSAMKTVYANAEVTIVAAAGNDSSFGLPGVNSARARIRQPCVQVQGHLLTATPCEPPEAIKNSKWWTRGWTYQEGLLARRRLIFTENEMVYECREMVARESVELPESVHKIAARRYPLHEHSRVFPYLRTSLGNADYTWKCLSEFTQRRLTYDDDILNAVLGVLQDLADRRRPVYQLCGVPMVLRDRASYLCKPPDRPFLEAFIGGLSWRLREPGVRRPGFPSWSWTGWKGVVSEPSAMYPYISPEFPVEIAIVIHDAPSQVLSWADFNALAPEEKAILPQNCSLKMTGMATQVYLHPPDSKERHWRAVISNGDGVVSGSLSLCKDPAQYSEFSWRLVEEPWCAVVLGYTRVSGYVSSPILLLLEEVGDCWERVGVITGEMEHGAGDSAVEFIEGEFMKQAFMLI
ncbi:hypothetical protein FZEAL_7848 [Fusarium zealandicum]|uniref:Heterokaryon incompatibility domain-containing protein n=1 Tax=Fusarium zealandicum TaxID=1053134 RepID=A0A8H4UFW0_9HYPO|nr:hypothetical protein FZEAL_7848 [Fusarium zealandicum]